VRDDAPGKLSSSPTTKVVLAEPPLRASCQRGVFFGLSARFSARRCLARVTKNTVAPGIDLAFGFIALLAAFTVHRGVVARDVHQPTI
jgi:hypothetical protein